MALPSLTAGGYDLESLGLRVTTITGPWSIPAIVDPTVVIPGRAGVSRSGAPTTIAARTVNVAGVILERAGVRTNADFLAKLDTLKPILAIGLLEMTQVNQPTRALELRLSSFDVIPDGPAYAAVSGSFTATFVANDVFFYSTIPSSRGFGATATAIPIGTAPSAGVIRIYGPATNPVLTVRNAAGSVVHTIGLTKTLAATDYEEIDLEATTIANYASGVKTTDDASLSSGDIEAFCFSPEDGDVLSGSYPTIECSGLTGAGNCELVYTVKYL
jgi:hypothetical protein